MNVTTASRPGRRAYTLLELLCTMSIIGILAVLLLPGIQSGFARAKRASCANNLVQIGVASTLWAHDHNDLFPAQVPMSLGGTRELAGATVLNPDVSFNFQHFQALSNELSTPWVLRCPAEKFRVRAENFASLSNQNVSYWLNTAAAYGRHDSALAGDRNVRTSGRTAWTFLQIGAGDEVEFSAELHGHRGNLLFGDGHVDNLDSQGLRAAFAAGTVSNLDLTLALPQGESLNGPAPTSAITDTSAPIPPAPVAAIPNTASPANATAKSPTNAPASSLPNFPNRPAAPGQRGAPDERLVLVTRLDGTVVTSSVPRRVTNAAGFIDGKRIEEGTVSPWMNFVEWLSRVATRGTYWLLFLLLLALLAFEFARRRARRNRRVAR